MTESLAGRPVAEVARRVADLWSELLEGRVAAAAIGDGDNFVALGGTSLLAMAFLAQAEARWGLDLPITALIDHPTLGGLAAAIAARAASTEEGWL